VIDVILNKLKKVTPKGKDSYMACCPAHDDRTPSLALSEMPDGRILINCFAGCSSLEIMASVGLQLTDLFPEGSLGDFKGWQQLQNQREESAKIKQEKGLSFERTFLAVIDHDRKAGIKISSADLAREQEAYLKVRAAE